jgi:hypothetical protein
MRKVYNTIYCMHTCCTYDNILYAYMLYICIVQVYSQIPIRETSKFARGNGEGKTFITILYITNVLDQAECATQSKVKENSKKKASFFNKDYGIKCISQIIWYLRVTTIKNVQQATTSHFSVTPKSV